jgi:hypothetical protein
MERATSLFSGKLPLDSDFVAIGAAVPCFGLAAECSDVPNSACPQALAAEETDLYLGLIQPTSVFGRVMNGETFP